MYYSILIINILQFCHSFVLQTLTQHTPYLHSAEVNYKTHPRALLLQRQVPEFRLQGDFAEALPKFLT